MKYKRILLKLSGEALAREQGHGINDEILNQVAGEIADLVKSGLEVGIVIGGGNIHRGVAGATKGMDRASSDYMGMLATVINSLALQDALERKGVSTRVQSAIAMNGIAEPYIRRRAIRHLEKGRVVIFAAGTGNPFFTTDTAAALRANEIGAQGVFKATKVDGVYDSDPAINKDAKKYDRLSFMDVISQGLKVMDISAVTLCMENKLDIIVFNMFNHGNIRKVVEGQDVGTVVS